MRTPIPMKLGALFLAATLTGCATTRFTDGYSCNEIEQTKPLMVPFLLEASISDKVTKIPECEEGKKAAGATLIDRPHRGTLGPMGYLFGKSFLNLHKQVIGSNDSPPPEKSRSQLVLEFYDAMLKHFGAVAISFLENPLIPENSKTNERACKPNPSGIGQICGAPAPTPAAPAPTAAK